MLNVGQLTAAEGELLESLSAALIDSQLKFDMEQRIENGTFVFEPVLHWYVTLEVAKKAATILPFAVAAE